MGSMFAALWMIFQNFLHLFIETAEQRIPDRCQLSSQPLEYCE
jgi:hypothetical protein